MRQTSSFNGTHGQITLPPKLSINSNIVSLFESMARQHENPSIESYEQPINRLHMTTSWKDWQAAAAPSSVRRMHSRKEQILNNGHDGLCRYQQCKSITSSSRFQVSLNYIWPSFDSLVSWFSSILHQILELYCLALPLHFLCSNTRPQTDLASSRLILPAINQKKVQNEVTIPSQLQILEIPVFSGKPSITSFTPISTAWECIKPTLEYFSLFWKDNSNRSRHTITRYQRTWQCQHHRRWWRWWYLTNSKSFTNPDDESNDTLECCLSSQCCKQWARGQISEQDGLSSIYLYLACGSYDDDRSSTHSCPGRCYQKVQQFSSVKQFRSFTMAGQHRHETIDL